MRPTKGGALQAPTHPHPADQLLVLQSDMRDHPYRDHKATDKEITLVRQVQATVEMTLPSVAAPLVRGERVAAHLGHLHTTLLKNIMTGHDLDPGHVQGHGGGRGRDRGRAPKENRDNNTSQTPPPTKSLTFTSLTTLTRAHARGVTCVKFSPDMTLLATGSADNTIKIYSVPPNPSSTPFKLLRTLRAHLAGINSLAWSPIGPPYTLASGSDDKSILLWSPLSSDFPISPSPLLGHSNYVYSLAFSPRGNMLVSGSYDEAVFLWDVRSGRVMRTLPAHSDPVSGVDFLRDGTMVCSCAADGLIRIWDSGTGQCLRTLVDEDRKAVTSVRFSPNGKFVLAWTLDSSIRLWRYIEGTCVKTYQGHTNQNFSLGGVVGNYIKAGTNGQRRSIEAFVASGSEDGDVVVWDVVSKEMLWRGKGHTDVVLAMDFGRAHNGRGLLVSVGKDRDIRLWMADGQGEANGLDHMKSSAEMDMDMDMGMDMDMTMDMTMSFEDERAGLVDTTSVTINGNGNGNDMDVDMNTPDHSRL
ncbi:hypothetical protein B0A52_01485 [Exophiala mesophila]|uniref:Mitochondrial division protein 1 n=1 Tax=Exophiala mesophila TaxID=212818 RepID=A0A438NF69_EXOME|nr:hypothetical protein B0A52_01485 [Exophiala mesophila]